MTALHIAAAAREIDDQNRRMAGLVVALGSAALAVLFSALIWIY